MKYSPTQFPKGGIRCPPQVAAGQAGSAQDDLFPGVALMSFPELIDQTAAVAAALAELGVRHHDRVLIMLPDGPGFDESFAGAVHQDAVPLPVSPLLPAPDLAAAAVQAGAQLVLGSPDQIHALAELDAEPAVLVDGPQGLGQPQ